MFKKSTGLSLQREYAAKRIRMLHKNDQAKTDLVQATIERLAGANAEAWDRYYDRISERLKTAPLTINLSAESWFGSENNYKTYATTYQKGVVRKDGHKVLTSQYKADGTETESADSRLFADEVTTLPAEWANASRLKHPQQRKLFKAMSTGGRDVNNLVKVDLDHGKAGYRIDNRSFNPYSKQVFAALNYGRRPNGSSINYGYSFITLMPALKRNALYFPGDTFTVASGQGGINGSGKQCTFETLGAILAKAPADLEIDIWDSCVNESRLGNTEDPARLLEAHIFDEVRMNKDVESLYLSRRTRDGDLSAVEWEPILENARVWARKNNVRFMQ